MAASLLQKEPIKGPVLKGILNVLLLNETMKKEMNLFMRHIVGFAEFYHHSFPPRGNILLNKKEESLLSIPVRQPNVNVSNDMVRLLPEFYLAFLIINPPELPSSNLHPNSFLNVGILT